MAKAHISATNATDKTIRAIDRKRERERRFILNKARDNAEEFATRLTQRLIDREILEINSVQGVRDVFTTQIKSLPDMEEFDIQMKVAPIRTLIPDPNILSLYLTAYVIEDLVDNPAIEDVFGEDLDIYRAIDSIFKVLRPQ
jgi:hypothetical protein